MEEDQLQEGGGHSLFTLKNLLILFIGLVLGYLIKGQAAQNITMGYDDYKIIVNEQRVDKQQEGENARAKNEVKEIDEEKSQK